MVPFACVHIPVLGPTELAVFRITFARTRDWADIEEMLAAETLDVLAVLDALGTVLEPDDALSPASTRRCVAPPAEPSRLITVVASRQDVEATSDSTRHPSQETMRKIQTQGVHHITLVGADRETSIEFWEGLLGMPFVFEQPNLDREEESHLYFDPGDGRLITVFTSEGRTPDPARAPTDPGCVHHLALSVSNATFRQVVERLEERGIEHSGVKDRGFMDSIYFTDPLGMLVELASYRFEPPARHTHADVLLAAHRLRVERGDHHIDALHVADAIEQLVTRSQDTLSGDRSARDPYRSRA